MQFNSLKTILFATMLAVLASCSSDPPRPYINDPCEFVECINGQFAYNADSSYCYCNCATGYYGDDCNTENLCITDSIVCVNGYCDSLTNGCICPPGYEGTFCQILSADKYEGSYTVTEECHYNSMIINNTYQSVINRSTTGIIENRLIIGNINGRSGTTLKLEVDGNSLTVPRHQTGLLEFTGGAGTYNPMDSSIFLNYIFTLQGVTYSCSADFIRNN